MHSDTAVFSAPTARERRSMALFCAVTMCYGWGWRGVYGHEAGAMLAGGLLAMAVCLASGRQDWYRRSVVAGLCGAVGWAWGGTLTNMEHRLYILSDTPIDVIYGFACIGLVGLLWCGIGGALVAMAFTRPRSELNRFIGPLTVMGAAFLVKFLYLYFDPVRRRLLAEYSHQHFHDGPWLATLVTLIMLVPYWIVRKADRPATRLVLECALAWWIGYLSLTKFGGLELSPPYRSEAWGGVVGILAALLWHHVRNNDRAAVMLTLYSMLAGCIAFILALQIHVPFVIGWGYFSTVGAWKHAEESFGFFMGLGVALGAVRLIGGRLAPPLEDADRTPLDLFGAFVLLVVTMWMNLKLNISQWANRYDVMPAEPFGFFKPPFPQLEGWEYFLIAGLLWTALVIDCLLRYRRGRLALATKTPFEKGALLFAIVAGVSLAGAVAIGVPAYDNPSHLASTISFLVLVCIMFWMLFARSDEGMNAKEPEGPEVPPSDPIWIPGWRFWALCGWVPIHILIASAIALAMVQGPWRKDEGLERHRFGPKATWLLDREHPRKRRSESSSSQTKKPRVKPNFDSGDNLEH